MRSGRTFRVGVALGLVLCLVGGAPGLASAQSSSPGGSPGFPETSPPVVLGPVTWTKGKAFKGDAIPGDLAQGTDGTSVLVGTVLDKKGRPTAAAWWSVDGTKWTRVDWEAPKGSGASGIVATPSGFAAVGSAGDAGSIWTSPDGVSWTTATVPNAALTDITHTSQGLVAIGVDGPGPSGVPTAWTSADGLTWEPHAMGAAGIPNIVAAGPDGTLVVAGVIVDPQRTIPTAIWTSADGAAWSEVSLAMLPQLPTSMNDLQWTPLGFTLALLHDNAGTRQGSVWVADDGVDWRPSLAVDDGVVTAIGTVGADTIAFGIDRTWRTTDGTTWEEAAGKGFKGYAVGAVTTLQDGRLLTAGQLSTGPRSKMATWLGQSAKSPLAWTTAAAGVDADEGPVVVDLAQVPGTATVMVGHVTDADGATTAAIWSSTDGATWQRDELEAPERSVVTAVTAVPDGLIAVGLDLNGEGLVWTSTDGTSWTLAKVPDATFNDMERSGDQVLVLGRVLSTGAPTVWSGSDLDPATWTPATVAAAGIPQFVATSEGGDQVVVGVAFGSDGTPGVAAWHSADGLAWAPVTLAGLAPGPTTAGSLERTPAGFVLSLYEYPRGTAAGSIWSSVDGLTWQRTLAVPDGPITAVGTDGTNTVAFGLGRSWWSADGVDWWVVPEPELRGATVAAATTLADGAVLAVGQRAVRGPVGTLATWTGIATP